MGRTFSELLAAKRRVKKLDALVVDLERQLAEAPAGELLVAKRRVKELEALVADLERQLAEAPAGERIEIPEFQVYGIQRHYFINKLEGLVVEPI